MDNSYTKQININDLKALSDRLTIKPQTQPSGLTGNDATRIASLLEMSAYDPSPSHRGMSIKRIIPTAVNAGLASLWAKSKNENEKQSGMLLTQLAEALGAKAAHQGFRVVLGTGQF